MLRYIKVLSLTALSVFVYCCPSSFAQEGGSRYEIAFLLGFEHTLAQRGPRHTTEVSEVTFLKPIPKTLGGMFNISPAKGRLFYGIEFLYDEFDYGYEAESHDLLTGAGLGISSGKLRAGDRIALYKAGMRVGYRIYTSRKISVNSVLTPSIGHFTPSSLLADTSGNKHERAPYYVPEIQYIDYPPMQREGLYFLLKGTVEFQYRWNRHFATSFMMSYQQGFKPFYIDTTNIVRPYEYFGLKEHKYWTKINGTALQWHFGFIYTFGRTLYHANDDE